MNAEGHFCVTLQSFPFPELVSALQISLPGIFSAISVVLNTAKLHIGQKCLCWYGWGITMTR